MSALYMIVGTLVALGVLVTFHEFGHFWVARRCGVKVLRFSVGFGMPLLRWHDRRGTEFVIAAIPLGGYVKMLDEREGEVPADQLDQSFNRKTVRQRIAIVAAGPIANFLLAMVFFWVLAMMGSQQVRPVIGAVEADSIASRAGLVAGQEIVSIDGEPTTGWGAVNLQLVRRLGESGTVNVVVRDQDSSAETPRALALDHWLKGADEPDPIKSLGIRPWRPALPPVLAELDPKGPAQVRAWLLPVWERMVELPDGLPEGLALKLIHCLEDGLSTIVAGWLARIEAAQQANPRDARLQYLAGMACLKRQLWGKAQQLLTQAASQLTDKTLRASAWRNLAELAEQRGDSEAAAHAWKSAAQQQR